MRITGFNPGTAGAQLLKANTERGLGRGPHLNAPGLRRLSPNDRPQTQQGTRCGKPKPASGRRG